MKQVLYNYMHQTVCFFTAVLLGELAYRCCKMLRERICYNKNYVPDGRLWSIISRALSCNKPTKYCLAVGCLACVLDLGLHPQYFEEVLHYACYAPVYWLCCAVRLRHSTLDYARFVREDHGLDYGAGMAASYYHGYLKQAMPSGTSEHLGIRDRMAKYEKEEGVKFAIKRLVLLIPNTMFVKPEIESVLLRKAEKPLDPVIKNRGGVKRTFQNAVYHLSVPNSAECYCVCLEGVTPLQSFFEAMHHEPSASWQMKAMQREILLKFYKHLKKLLDFPATRDEVELVLYDAFDDAGNQKDVGIELLEHIRRQNPTFGMA